MIPNPWEFRELGKFLIFQEFGLKGVMGMFNSADVCKFGSGFLESKFLENFRTEKWLTNNF